MNELKPGDVCTYSFGGKNRSCAVVEIVRIVNDTRGVAEVRFLEVIVDGMKGRLIRDDSRKWVKGTEMYFHDEDYIKVVVREI